MNIAFLTSDHLPLDDRIFYHLGLTLVSAGHKVEIISSKSNIVSVKEGISLHCFEGSSFTRDEKTIKFINILTSFQPAIIICSEPFTILAAHNYRKISTVKPTLIYDITEWFPSEKNLENLDFISKLIKIVKLTIVSIYSSSLADSFIFGEWYKSRPYRLLFPFRKFEYITYYPDLDFITLREPALIRGRLRLLYSGRISKKKGFKNFIDVLLKLAKLFPGMIFRIKLIGWYGNKKDEVECEDYLSGLPSNISIERTGRLGFREYLNAINDSDIFTDFREISLETNLCLPIKLFYFIALGRPVIHSDLVAVRKYFSSGNFGFLTDPGDTENIVNIISRYINDNELYKEHCTNARIISEEKYNWEKIKMQLVKFISSYEA